eukprot:34688_1
MSGLYISDDEAQAPLIRNKSSTPITIHNALNIMSYQNDSDHFDVDEHHIPSPETIQHLNKRRAMDTNLTEQGHYEPPKWRWFVLTILCIQSICIWYSFDTLSILHNEFFNEFQLTNMQYTLLYSIAVFPSIVLSIFASYIIDKYGITYSLLISLLFSFCGESLFAISCTTLSYKLMLFGRTLYGIGASWNGICSFIIIYHYFNHKEFATSLSISFSCIRLGFIVNDFITIYIVNTFHSIAGSIWFGVMLIFISFVSTLYMLGANTSWLYMNSIAQNRDQIAAINHIHRNTLHLDPSHLHSFKIGFWLLSLLCGLGFAFFSTWNTIGVALMQTRYGLSESTADYYLLILYIIPCVLSPLYGVILDNNKAFYSTLFIGGMLGIIGHICMMLRFEISNEYLVWLNYLSTSPTMSLVFIGFGYTMFNSALWPSIPFMIDEQKLGTGYGLMYAFYCVCYSVSQLMLPMFMKSESDHNVSKYDHLCMYLIALCVMYCVIAVILWLWKKDDDYRVIQYKSISSISNLSPILQESENGMDEEGDVDDYGIGSTLMMGAIDSNVSTMSLFSEDRMQCKDTENDGDIDDDMDTDGTQEANNGEVNVSETMLGYAGENEMIVLKNVNDDNSSVLSVLTE